MESVDNSDNASTELPQQQNQRSLKRSAPDSETEDNSLVSSPQQEEEQTNNNVIVEIKVDDNSVTDQQSIPKIDSTLSTKVTANEEIEETGALRQLVSMKSIKFKRSLKKLKKKKISDFSNRRYLQKTSFSRHCVFPNPRYQKPRAV